MSVGLSMSSKAMFNAHIEAYGHSYRHNMGLLAIQDIMCMLVKSAAGSTLS